MKKIFKKLFKSEKLWIAIGGGVVTLISRIDAITNFLSKVSPEFAQEFPLYVVSVVVAIIIKDSIKDTTQKIKARKKK